MSRGKISVCIATYNGAEFIAEQIESIVSQLDINDEVIISDDSSTDDTIKILKLFNDDRIKININKGKKGSTSNFENALKLAKGDYIFLSDQDDIWKEDKVEKCIEYLEKYDFLVSDAVIVNKNKEIQYNSFFTVRKPYKSLFGNILKFGYLGCCFAFKRNILEKSLPFPSKSKYATHDNWLFLIAAAFFKVKIINEKLILYRRHGNNVSTGGLTDKTSFLFKIKYRFYLIISILKRAFRK